MSVASPQTKEFTWKNGANFYEQSYSDMVFGLMIASKAHTIHFKGCTFPNEMRTQMPVTVNTIVFDNCKSIKGILVPIFNCAINYPFRLKFIELKNCDVEEVYDFIMGFVCYCDFPLFRRIRDVTFDCDLNLLSSQNKINSRLVGELRSLLDANRKGLTNCQRGCFNLIMIKKYRSESSLDPLPLEIVEIIAKTLWKSRYHKEWYSKYAHAL